MNSDNYVDGLELRIKELTAEIQRLKIALSKYGHHIEGCGHGWSCTCGYLDVMVKAADRIEELEKMWIKPASWLSTDELLAELSRRTQ